jgi:hypothetical protein
MEVDRVLDDINAVDRRVPSLAVVEAAQGGRQFPPEISRPYLCVSPVRKAKQLLA